MNELEAAWKGHIAMDGDMAFPRQMGFPKQELVATVEDYLFLLNIYVGNTDIFTAVFPEQMKQKNIINKLYIDIDGDTYFYEYIYDQHKKFVDAVFELLGESPRQYFTGKKGTANYFDFKPIEIENYHFVGRRVAQKLFVATKLAKDRSYDKFQYPKYVDTSVLGDVNRNSRVPYTKHDKTKLICFPIDRKYDYGEILANATCNAEFKQIIPKDFTNTALMDLFDFVIDEEYPDYQTKLNKAYKYSGLNSNGDNYLKNMLDLFLVVAPEITDGRHRLIYTIIAPALVELSYSDTEAIAYCKQFIESSGETFNYNIENYVRRQLRNKRMRNIKPWSFDKLFDHHPEMIKVFRKAGLI